MENGTSMKDRAPVSVVIPCFNCAQTIERAVRSIANQTFLPAEVWIIDDGSDEETKRVIEAVKKRYEDLFPINIITFKTNSGPSRARNAGWDASTQPYIAFLDADDSWHPKKLEIQYKWMKGHPEVALSGHGWKQVKEEISEDSILINDVRVKRISLIEHLFIKRYFLTPTVMIKRELPFRFNESLRQHEDYSLWLEILGSGFMAYYLSAPLTYIYKAPYGEKGLSKNIWTAEKIELSIFKRLKQKGMINHPTWIVVSLFSILKFIRRIVIVSIRKFMGKMA